VLHNDNIIRGGGKRNSRLTKTGNFLPWNFL